MDDLGDNDNPGDPDFEAEEDGADTAGEDPGGADDDGGADGDEEPDDDGDDAGDDDEEPGDDGDDDADDADGDDDDNDDDYFDDGDFGEVADDGGDDDGGDDGGDDGVIDMYGGAGPQDPKNRGDGDNRWWRPRVLAGARSQAEWWLKFGPRRAGNACARGAEAALVGCAVMAALSLAVAAGVGLLATSHAMLLALMLATFAVSVSQVRPVRLSL